MDGSWSGAHVLLPAWPVTWRGWENIFSLPQPQPASAWSPGLAHLLHPSGDLQADAAPITWRWVHAFYARTLSLRYNYANGATRARANFAKTILKVETEAYLREVDVEVDLGDNAVLPAATERVIFVGVWVSPFEEIWY
ncbi:hypothetical protein NL676_034120 [Syzygium grande]|nr:hypothetical protein NL676_034120 [Syzygium grande]